MKTFASVAIGLVVGIVIGIASSFKAAEKKAEEMIEEELAEVRRAQREGTDTVSDETEKEESVDFTEETSEEEENNMDIMDIYENLTEEYVPAKKPYILEDKPADYLDSHEYLDSFSELNLVYDVTRGRLADEDGSEFLKIKGELGFNNLNRLISDEKLAKKNLVTIINEASRFIYYVHVGDLYDYLDEPVEEDYDD